MFPYRLDAASDDPKARLAEGPERTRNSLRGLLFVITLASVLLIIFFILLSLR